jgi:hypothetical protein
MGQIRAGKVLGAGILVDLMAASRTSPRKPVSGYQWLVLLASPLLAAVFSLIYGLSPGEYEVGLTRVAWAAGFVILLPPLVYLARTGRKVNPHSLGLFGVLGVLFCLVATYFFFARDYVSFPADTLIWSESEFVSDIHKFQVGYPIFSEPSNNDSFIYPPGAQLLTYGLAHLTLHPNAIPVYRGIQVFFTLLAVWVGLLCCRRISAPGAGLMLYALPPLLFLIATNKLTNPFVQFLHNDALTQLITAIAFWLLLRYIQAPSTAVLAMMAVLPAAGFWVKQSLVIWAGFYCIHLALFDRQRSVKKVVGFGIVSFGLLGLNYGVGLLLWGQPFVYWLFTVLREHGVDPLRSWDHARDVWFYYVILAVGAAALLRRGTSLASPFLISFALLATETYTSGIAYMLNHIGPGCFLAGVWFIAAIPRLWEGKDASWFGAIGRVALVPPTLYFLSVMRLPIPVFSEDIRRYVAEIENEFAGHDPSEVMLDSGSWVYFNGKAVVQDRVAPIGDQAFSAMTDLAATRERFASGHYKKLLFHGFDSPQWWYDGVGLPRSTGLREAVLKGYREVRRIRKVERPAVSPLIIQRVESAYLLGEVTVFERR